MRTEDDLRAAFGSLEGQVPDGSRLLSGVARSHRRRTVRRRAGAGLGAAGLAVATVVAVTQAPAAPHNQTTAIAQVRVKLLAAMSAAGNDILVTHDASPGGGPGVADVYTWVYPWAASPGQRAQYRMLISYNGKKASDFSASYTVPDPGSRQMLSGPGIEVDYSSRTWSKGKGQTGQSELNPSVLRRQIASGAWTVSGPVEFRGHRALKLTETATVHVKPGQTAQSTTQLWVDASTYLPLREYSTTRGVDAGPPFVADFQLLPPTSANLALLNAVIPPGFHQIGPWTGTSH